MTDAIVKEKPRRLSRIWIVPALALLLGGGVVLKSLRDQGPLVEVHFATADGLSAGETLVKRLSVEVGLVENVQLDTESTGVIASIRFEPAATEFLREGTDFWVVRPRIGASGVSGLSTLLSGGYIEISPGLGSLGARSFVGLEVPPRISQGTAGLPLKLVSEQSVSVSSGSPILYHGVRVGEVETVNLSVAENVTHIHIFIESPYDALVSDGTRFWNVSGVRVSTGASGLSVQTESLEALISGGIAFGVPSEWDAGGPVESHHEFVLYGNPELAQERAFEHRLEYLLMFNSSVRGLTKGAPVEYRGLRTGTVIDFSFNLVPEELRWSSQGHALIPVLIELEPGRFAEDSLQEVERLRGILAEGVSNGMRAQLATGSLLTGSLFVNFDFQANAEPAQIQTLDGREVFPTIEGDISRLQDQFTRIMAKIEEMPINELLAAATRTLDSIDSVGSNASGAVSDLRELLADPELRSISKDIGDVLTIVHDVLGGLRPESEAYRGLVDTLQTAKGAIEGIAPESMAYQQLVEAIQGAKAAIDGLSPTSEAYAKLVQTLSAMRLTIQEAGNLLSTIEDRPSSLLFSGSRGADPVPGTSR